MTMKCIKCNSVNLTISEHKKGFSGGKALLGAMTLGPLGLLAGMHKKDKLIVSFRCNDCFEVFSLNDVKEKEQKEKRIKEFNESFVVNYIVMPLIMSAIFAVPLSWTNLSFHEAWIISIIVGFILFLFTKIGHKN